MTDIVPKIQIAALLTCFNRKDKTLFCLNKLFNQIIPDNIQICVYLVDDASTDGTRDAVTTSYPEVNLIQGGGNLFWNQGMRLAWQTAMRQKQYDYYLLLNDDTDIYDDAITRLLSAEEMITETTGITGIIVGSTQDPETRLHTYGGNNRQKGILGNGFRFVRVPPGELPKECDTFNANCALISTRIVDEIGILSDKFTHGIGDYDYGLRARERGYLCWIVPGYIGNCSINSISNTWLDPSLPLDQRHAIQKTPKGFPTNEWLYFVKRHAGYMWIFAWLQLKLRLYFPKAWSLVRGLRKYIL